MQRIGILNHVGCIWTRVTFDSNEAAQAYIDRVQRHNPTWHPSNHGPAPVRVTLSVIKSPVNP
jgi:hypothetical protein